MTAPLTDPKGADIVITPQSRGGAYSREYLRETISPDCGAVAAVALGRAGTGRDIAVLLIGGLLSMGTALLLDSLLQRLTERKGLRWD